MKGLSLANLFYMRAFADAYPEEEIVQQLAGQIPQWHNVVIMTGIKDPGQREWYIPGLHREQLEPLSDGGSDRDRCA